jgi:hypothetical protein
MRCDTDAPQRERTADDPYRWSPSEVVKLARSRIRPEDGAVPIKYAADSDTVLQQPTPPVALDALPGFVYACQLLEVARAIYQATGLKGCAPDEADARLSIFASYLTGYMHDPAFLQRASDLIRYDSTWGWQPPYIPIEDLQAYEMESPLRAR